MVVSRRSTRADHGCTSSTEGDTKTSSIGNYESILETSTELRRALGVADVILEEQE